MAERNKEITMIELMRGVSPAFHQTCNNCHEKGHFANSCMSTNKLYKEKLPTTAPVEVFDEDTFFIDGFFDILNGVKNNNQKIITFPEKTNTEWSVTLKTNGTTSATKSNLVLKSM